MNFNGNPLPDGIGVLGWKVSTPTLSVRTLDLPGVRGLIRTGGKLGSRTVTLRLALLGDSQAETLTILDALSAWCTADAPAPLYLPGRSDRYLLAECEAYPQPDAGDPGAELELRFACHTPEYLSAQEQTCPSGSPPVIGGTLPTPLRIEMPLAGPLTDPIWLFDADRTLRLRGSVPAGALAIDTALGSVTLDGVDVSDQATLDSDLAFELTPGPHTVSFPAGVAGTIRWHNRWL